MDPTTQAQAQFDPLVTSTSSYTTQGGTPVQVTKPIAVMTTTNSNNYPSSMGAGLTDHSTSNSIGNPGNSGTVGNSLDGTDHVHRENLGGNTPTSHVGTGNTGNTSNNGTTGTTGSALNNASSNIKNTASSMADTTTSTMSNASANIQNTASSMAESTASTMNNASANIKSTASSVADNVQPTITGLRQRVNHLGSDINDVAAQAADHPAVKDAKKGAQRQIAQFREMLGRSPLLMDLEKRTGVDRVLMVVVGAVLYFLIIPLNFLHLAQPVTTLLTYVPPMMLAVRVLDDPNEQRTRLLLSYFVVFGFVQFAESLMAGFLAKRIPQYYTLKLVFLAYLIHPRTKGALKIHQSVLKPLLAAGEQAVRQSTPTPPTSKPSHSSANSPTFPPSAPPTSTLPSSAYPSSTLSSSRKEGGLGASAATSGFTDLPSSTAASSGLPSKNPFSTAGSGYSNQTSPGKPSGMTYPSASSSLGNTGNLDGLPQPSLTSGGQGFTLPSGGGTGVGLVVPNDKGSTPGLMGSQNTEHGMGGAEQAAAAFRSVNY